MINTSPRCVTGARRDVPLTFASPLTHFLLPPQSLDLRLTHSHRSLVRKMGAAQINERHYCSRLEENSGSRMRRSSARCHNAKGKRCHLCYGRKKKEQRKTNQRPPIHIFFLVLCFFSTICTFFLSFHAAFSVSFVLVSPIPYLSILISRSQPPPILLVGSHDLTIFS